MKWKVHLNLSICIYTLKKKKKSYRNLIPVEYLDSNAI